MPLVSAQTFEDILLKLSVLRYIFKSRSKRGRYDLNKQAENFFRDILNLIEEFNLVNLNEKLSNTPAIDLGDKENRICIQVTAENGSGKIRETINGFIKQQLYNQYDRLVILIITEKLGYTTNFDTNSKFVFSREDDIWDIDDLLEKIEKLDLDTAENLKDYLSKELAPITAAFAEPNSLFAKAETMINTPPKTVANFFRFCEFEEGDEYWNEALKAVMRFYEILSGFSRKQREYISFIVNRGTIKRTFGCERIRIFPTELENMLNLEKIDCKLYFQVLENAGLAEFDPDDYPQQIELRFLMVLGEDLFVTLRKFLGSKEKIDKLLVDGDFSLLD